MPAPPPPPPDHRARNVALAFAGLVAGRGGDRVACRAGSAGAMSAATRLAVIVGVLAAGLVGYIFGGYPGAAAGLVLGVVGRRGPLAPSAAVGVVDPWWRRRRAIAGMNPSRWPMTGPGVEFGIRTASRWSPCKFSARRTGQRCSPARRPCSPKTPSTSLTLLPLLHQSLGLAIESLSVVSVGARRRSTGDYPRVYDTLIGTPPYAGQRETWLIARIGSLPNAEALEWRTSVGTATLAAAQRISAALRQQGIRAKVATATDIVELGRRLGSSALNAQHQRWRTVRGEGGWLTTNWYRPRDVTAENLEHAWSLRADGIIQNITLIQRRQHDSDGDRAQCTAADSSAERHAADIAGKAGAGAGGQSVWPDAHAARACVAPF